jgi:hypothetical protein
MYPISANEKLNLDEIAHHWAIELRHADNKLLLRILIRAWWAGEFGRRWGGRRVQALKLLFKYDQDCLAFAIPHHPKPKMKEELPDGGVEVLRVIRVPLPSDDPSAWTETNCADAFEVLAQRWTLGVMNDMDNTLSFVRISEATFTRWVRARRYHRPKFWAERTSPAPSAPGGGVSGTPPLPLVAMDASEAEPAPPSNPRRKAVTSRRQKKAPVRERVILEMQRHLNDGTTARQQLRDEKEEALADIYRCSRETARKAREEVLKKLES